MSKKIVVIGARSDWMPRHRREGSVTFVDDVKNTDLGEAISGADYVFATEDTIVLPLNEREDLEQALRSSSARMDFFSGPGSLSLKLEHALVGAAFDSLSASAVPLTRSGGLGLRPSPERLEPRPTASPPGASPPLPADDEHWQDAVRESESELEVVVHEGDSGGPPAPPAPSEANTNRPRRKQTRGGDVDILKGEDPNMKREGMNLNQFVDSKWATIGDDSGKMIQAAMAEFKAQRTEGSIKTAVYNRLKKLRDAGGPEELVKTGKTRKKIKKGKPKKNAGRKRLVRTGRRSGEEAAGASKTASQLIGEGVGLIAQGLELIQQASSQLAPLDELQAVLAKLPAGLVGRFSS